MAALRFIVSGKVQGVFFRASTQEQARRLGLSGHALNRANGTVEVVVSGEPVALDALERWLQRGPPKARVDALKRDTWSLPVSEGFVIG